MKGFKDNSGTFHPISQSKGVRSRRDTTEKTKGVRQKRNRFHPKEPPTFGKSSKNVEISNDEVTIYDDNGQEVVKWVSDEWKEDPSIIPAIKNAIKLANQGKIDELKERIGFIERGTVDRKARDQFDEEEEMEPIVAQYSLGDVVMISSDNDNDNYDEFRNKKLKIIHVATNRDEHQGFDEGVGQALYDLETVNGKEVGFSLYDYELESA